MLLILFSDSVAVMHALRSATNNILCCLLLAYWQLKCPKQTFFSRLWLSGQRFSTTALVLCLFSIFLVLVFFVSVYVLLVFFLLLPEPCDCY